MNELIAALIVLCYSFAAGIFYVLSCPGKTGVVSDAQSRIA